jgi:ABC-type phosphate transport system substrate-binding protein
MKKMTLLLACLALFSSNLVWAEIAIIVSSNSGAAEINAKTAKKLFLSKIKSIPGMSNITLVGQLDESPIKADFTKKVTKKGMGKYKAYWSKMIFSGKAVPPTEFANDEEVRAYVAKNKDAVGYIDATSVDSSVKVLMLVP